jgi:hypothetical protein
MQSQQINHTRPKPARSLNVSGLALPQRLDPAPSRFQIHLASMSASYDGREQPCNGNGIALGKSYKVKLQVFRPEFTDNDMTAV